MNIKTGVILLFLLFFIHSCVKETIDFEKISKKVEWDPKLAIPLVNDDVTLKEIIEAADDQGYVKEYSDGLLYIVYEDELSSPNAEDIIQIPNQPAYRDSVVFPVLVPPSPNPITVAYASYLDFAVNNTDALDSIFFKSGTISLSVNPSFSNSGRITITIDSLLLNNQPLSRTIDFPGGAPVSVNLAGYKLYLKRNGGKPNQLKLRYTVTLDANGPAVPPGSKVVINTQFTSPMFSAIFGYISTFNLFNYPAENIKLDIFELDQDANVYFEDPRLKLYISNSFGVPVSLSLNNLSTHADGSNTTYNLTISPAYNPFSPKFVQSFANFTPALDTLLLDTSKIQNLDKAIATVPQDFYFDAASVVNPNGTAKSFLLDTSNLKAKVVVELPFDLRAGIFEVADTIDDLDLSTGIDDFSIVDSIKIYNTIENHIPFEVKCQLYFTDSIYNKIDSLYSPANQPVIASGTVINGRVTTAAKKTTVSEFTGNRIKNLEKVRKGIMKFSISTTDAGSRFVKFYSTDNIKIKLGMQVNLKVRSLDQL